MRGRGGPGEGGGSVRGQGGPGKAGGGIREAALGKRDP